MELTETEQEYVVNVIMDWISRKIKNKKRVILFQIPAATTATPTGWNDHFYGRNGESLGAGLGIWGAINLMEG